MKAILLLLPWLLIGRAEAACRPVNIEEFRAATAQGPDRLVFFASWCGSCAPHITRDHIADTIFVALADDAARADKVLQLHLQERAAAAHCFVDKDDSVARAFHVKSLPMEKSRSTLGP